jgi:hypothetical protein
LTKKTRYPQYGELAPRDFYIKLISDGASPDHIERLAKVQGVTAEQIYKLVEGE